MLHLAKPVVHILFLVELIRRLCLHTVLHGLGYSAGCEQVVVCDSSGPHNVGYGDLALTKNIKKKRIYMLWYKSMFFWIDSDAHTWAQPRKKL